MQVCDAATDYINGAGRQALESLPGKLYYRSNFLKNDIVLFLCMYMHTCIVTVDIDGVSQINYALIQSPTFTSSYVQADIKVELLQKFNKH